ncbi:transglutaminase domain-containing protein [Nanoarchaeota archaeon]
MRELAAEIANGKEDLYEVVFDMATWINKNINYSLDTITSEASQKSSWVLTNRRGVCDELTSLYISMLRTLGIPAKFVYGESYTNIGVFSDDWGPHGWAEVYFPGYGWVPFDPTYGQYGYLDTGHIKMGESIDARRPSLKYAMKGRYAQIGSGHLDIDVDVQMEGKKLDPELDIKAEIYYAETGFGSYNLLTATVKNNDNYYKPAVLQLIPSKDVDIGDRYKHVLLKPKETKKVYWIVKLSSNLDKDYIYTFPFTVKSDRGAEDTIEFQAESNNIAYDKAEFQQVVTSEEAENVKMYSGQMDFDCEASDKVIYTGGEITLTCTLKNTGTRHMRDINVCYGLNCEDADISPGDSETFEFPRKYSEAGVNNMVIRAENKDLRKTSYNKIIVLDKSSLNVDVDAPSSIEYGEIMELKLVVDKTSHSTPKNVNVQLEFQDTEHEWFIDSLDKPNRFDINVKSSGFTFNNEFKVIVDYEDAIGEHYTTQKSFNVELENLSKKEWLVVAMNTMGYKLLSWVS